MPTDRLAALDNACWHALATRHASHAERSGGAVRYDPEVSVFSAVDSVTPAVWTDLVDLAGPGAEVFLFRDELPDVPDRWATVARGAGIQMIHDGSVPDVAIAGLRPLDVGDVDAMLDLIAATTPGPFRRGTVELGGYVGVFDGERLVAMAGRRLATPGYVEISAVCTHPDARGRGLAAAVTMAVADGIRAEGDTPYLQVAAHNAPAIRIYERLGFVARREVTFLIATTPG